jgi:hypothetical protein
MTPTLDEVRAVIQKFGPILRLHSQEKYLLDEPEAFLAAGLCSLNAGLITAESDYDNFQQQITYKKPVTSGQSLLDAVENAKAQTNAGASSFRYWLNIDDTLKPGNVSRAKAQVSVKKSINDNVLDLQFWFFYGFNGPGKFRIVAGNIFTDYREMDTAGRHYGDWEHVTIRVARTGDGWGLRNVYLSRHAFTIWVNDLSKLQFSGTKPIVYAGRDSHAHYETAGMHFYLRPWSVDFKIGTAAVDLYDLTDDGGISFDTSDPNKYAIFASDFPEHNVTRPAWAQFTARWGQYEKLMYPYDLTVSGQHLYTYTFKEVECGPTGPLQHVPGVGLTDAWSNDNMGAGPDARAWLLGDFNGDGRPEIVQCWGGHSLGMIMYGSDGHGGIKNLGNSPMSDGPDARAWLVGDFNGDGRPEIVQCWGGNSLGMIMYGGDGGSGLKQLWRNDNMKQGPGARQWLVGDFNGDRRPEIVQCWGSGSSLGMIMYGSDGGSGLTTLWAGGMPEGADATAWLVGDFTGVGRPQIVQCWGKDSLGMIMYGVDDSRSLREQWKGNFPDGPKGTWLVGDFNGDGKAEIVQCWGSESTLGMIMYGSDGGSALKQLWRNDNMKEGAGARAWLVGDFNGDGKPEIVQCWGKDKNPLGMIMYGRDGGGGLKMLWQDGMKQGPDAVTWQAADFDGDGVAEIVQGWGSSTLGMILYSRLTE